MVDLKGQYLKIKQEINNAIQKVIDSNSFINGPQVNVFAKALSSHLNVNSVIPCGNGTDALQIALMTLELQRGDEVMVPAFTYIATAEVIALLGLKPIMVDVDYDTFNLTPEIVKENISPKTKVIVPVHLFGQSAEMEGIIDVGKKFGCRVIEDNAQALGADYFKTDGTQQKVGTLGDIGCTSFYPSKNLGAYGDGGAIFTNNKDLAEKARMISNHGQSKRYYHDLVGCNSRLDSIQAAILEIKLKYLSQYENERQKVAKKYDDAFANVDEICIPKRVSHSNHVFHQYTIKVLNGQRNALKDYLSEQGIPSMIYYPVPLYKQKAFNAYWNQEKALKNTEKLCGEVLSLPIHTEMTGETQDYIIDMVRQFFRA